MHYRIPLFRSLNEALDGELIVVYGQAPGQDTIGVEEELGFRRILIRNHWVRGEALVYQNLIHVARSLCPTAILTEHSVRNLGLFELLFAVRRSNIPVLLWGHGRSQRRPLNTPSLQNSMHRWLIRNADGYVAYTRSRAAEVSAIFPNKPVFFATNTLDTQVLFKLRRDLEQEGRGTVLQRLGLKDKHYILFIGRLHSDKSPALVLDLARALKSRGRNIGVLFIGSGPERARLVAAAHGLPDVHFLGEINDWKASAPYIYVCSALVMPQWVGLAANHGLALGTPILCFTPQPGGPIHPPEIDFVVEDLTGFEVPYGDWELFVTRAELLLDKHAHFKRQCIEYAKREIAVERWLEGMLEAIRTVTSDSGTARSLAR